MYPNEIMMDDLIQKYIDDRCSPEELIIVLEWLKTPEGQKALSGKMDEIWALENKLQEVDLNPRLIEPLKVSYSSTQANSGPTHALSRKNRYVKLSMMAAAVVIGIISVVYFLQFNINRGNEVAVDNSSFTVKQNAPGMKSTFKLPDGSVVKLNSDSELKFASQFQGIREVFLSGEAFFEVAENEEMPFVVRINDLSITALGTSFNINAFGNLPDIDICLSDGKVKVEHLDQKTEVSTSVMLVPGEKAVFQKKGTKLSKGFFDPDIELAWKDKTLVFDSSDFPEFKAAVERWYGVQIIVDEALKTDWKFTGRFHNSSLESVMKSLVYSRELAFSIDNDQVKIYKPMR